MALPGYRIVALHWIGQDKGRVMKVGWDVAGVGGGRMGRSLVSHYSLRMYFLSVADSYIGDDMPASWRLRTDGLPSRDGSPHRMSQSYAPPPSPPVPAPPGAYPQAAPPKTKRSMNCCGGCCLGVVVMMVMPIAVVISLLNKPFDPLPDPLPDTWEVGGPQLEATWAIPTSREIGYEQLTISPWLMTARGPIFLAQEEHQVRFERWIDRALEAKYTPTDFWAFDGVAHGNELVLVGENKEGNPALLRLRPEDFKELSRVDISPTVIPPEEFHGAALLPWYHNDAVGLLIEAKTEAAIQKRTEGIAPLQFTMLDVHSGSGAAPITLPFTAELPDYALYQRNPSPTLYSCWLDVAQFQLRPTHSGMPPIGIFDQYAQQAVDDPDTRIDVDAADKAVELQQGDRHFHRHWTQPLQYPPVVVSLDAGNYTMPPQMSGGWPSPAEWVTLAQGKIDEKRGGLELQMQQFVEGVDVRGLQVHHPDKIGGPIDVVDASLTEAIRNELAIAGSAPYALASWSRTELLIAHVVLFPPKGLNSGDPILRLGIINVDSGSLTWHGWMPFPEELQERILTLERWRIAVYDGTLVITVHQDSTVETLPRHERCPRVWLGARITLPEHLRSPWYGELETTY